MLAFIQADVAFHTALYRLSGNRAIEDTVAAQWPHLKRSMGAVLADAAQRPLVWAEHRAILRHVLAGDAAQPIGMAVRKVDIDLHPFPTLGPDGIGFALELFPDKLVE